MSELKPVIRPVLSNEKKLRIMRKVLKGNNDRDKVAASRFLELMTAIEIAVLEQVGYRAPASDKGGIVSELKPCFCGAPVNFHHDEDCDGCHYLECKACQGWFDFSMAVDPDNKIEDLAELRARIAAHWNARRAPASEGEQK
ncbi:hypothetical protein [Burkholderia cepacia]|uniref:hypothetical protein n=1 Tax=Burkholderia cepacia TaxID=292 RepID=UPI00075ED2FA|nr:hypothetical protein [Burkholderia cepacia]KWF90336.1 hypothetical protein WL95_27285 [Burkholderia cepacia]